MASVINFKYSSKGERNNKMKFNYELAPQLFSSSAFDRRSKMENKRPITQYFASISANILLIGFGCGISWISMALPLLESDKSPLATGAMNVDEVSWIGSALAMGCIVGNISYGYMTTLIGSRNSILSLGIPQMASWLFMMFGTSPMHLGISRILTGIVMGGAQVSSSVYTAEIADNEIRGELGLFYQFFRNFGILFAYSIGSYYNYIISSYFFASITIAFFATFIFIPSTPQYLLQRNKIESAEKSFKFYNKHQFQMDSKTYSLQFECLKSVNTELKNQPKLTIKDIVDVRHQIVQAVMFALFICLTANLVVLTYGTNIIAKSGTHLSPEVSSISVALVQIAATFTAYMLIDRKGRKILLVSSTIGCALSHGAMAAYLYLHKNGVDTSMFHWMPIVCMCAVIFTSSSGIFPLSLIVMAEIFPAKLRSFGVAFETLINNILLVIVLKSFPILVGIIGLEGCLSIFCVGCAIGGIYMLLFVEETKGKDLNGMDDIQLEPEELIVKK